MKKTLISLIGLLLQNITYGQAADISSGIIDGVSYPKTIVQSVSVPAGFNLEEAIEVMKKARKEGDVATANRLANYIHQSWLEQREIQSTPMTHGSNSKEYPRFREESQASDNPSAPRWGTDVRIDPRSPVTGVKIASLSNGHLYTISVWDSLNSDRILVHRSTNNGLSWDIYWNYDFGTAYEIEYPNIRVVNDTIVLSYILHRNSDSFERTWFITCLPGSSFSWIYYGSPTGDFNRRDYSHLHFTDDSPIYPGEQYLYATWVTANQTGIDTTWVVFARSNGLDVTHWELGPTNIHNTVGNDIYFKDTRIAFGSATDRMWLIASLHPSAYPTIYDESVWGWYSDNFGATWSSYFILTPYQNRRDERECAIAGAHNNQNWVLLYTQKDTAAWTNLDILMTYSTNDGANWTTVNWVMPYQEFLPDIFVDNQSTGFYGALRQNTAYGELVKYKFGAIDNPTYWTLSLAINDDTSDVSDVFGPSICRNMATGDAAIAWTDYAGGIYSIWYDAEGTGIAEDQTRVFNGLSLNLIPNPSNGKAMLSYTIKEQGNVRICLYDATGRMVKNLLNEIQPPGNHRLDLNNQELPNGIYFIRVQTSEERASKRMVILR